jgi:16S rRNA processing protein RimM
VRRPHGLDGALLVSLHGDDASNLLNARRVFLCGKPGRIPYKIDRASEAGKRGGHAQVRLWLDGLSGRERAEAFVGAGVAIPESELPDLPEGEFYWRELIGCTARLPDGRALGRVEEILATGSSDLLVIGVGSEQRLLPCAEGVLVRLDREAGEIWIDPPAELLEDA